MKITSVSEPDQPPPRGLAARLGRWSADHPKKAIAGWVALVLVATGSYGLGQKKLTVADSANGDSAAAQRLLEDGNFEQPAQEQVLLQTRGEGTIRSAAGRDAARDLVAVIRRTGRAAEVRAPFAPGNAGQISADGRSALVLFSLKGDPDTAQERVEPVVTAVSGVASEHPALRIEQFGAASASKALEETLGEDFRRAEASSIPLTLVILWLAFAALVAALLPLILALTAIMIATGLVGVTSHALPVDGSANSMILLIGLAVGVDYSLFYFRRAREERAAGASNRAALATAASTSGKAVLTSGLTVIVAMTAMFVTGQPTFMGMAEATAIVVAVAMLGSLTVLPALLSQFGDGVDRGRIPFLSRWLEGRRRDGESRFWAAVVRPALARPLLVTVAAASLLVLLALPAVRLETAVPGANDLPHDLPVMQTYDRLQAAFPGGPMPAQVVVSARDVEAPAVRRAIAALERKALATGQMHQPITVHVNDQRTLARIDVPLVGNGIDDRSQEALQTLRKKVVPATVGTLGPVHVTGATAYSVDFNDQLKERQLFVFALVLVLAFLLLMWAFRSLVIPATAIVLNLLSVGAAYGVLVAIFQWGWGSSVIGLEDTGPVAAWLPLFLFVILFGLSMDYHVFILSRIREAHDAGVGTREAVRRGITHSAGVITSAAIVMVAVFSTFATLSVVSSKQMGVGLAVAILLDATIVRGLLVPAVMILLGERNWYLPTWLAKLLGSKPATVHQLPVNQAASHVAAAGER